MVVQVNIKVFLSMNKIEVQISVVSSPLGTAVNLKAIFYIILEDC